MSALAIKLDTPTTEYVKERLEQAGYALQCLPADKPREFSVAWPDIPRTSLEAWVLQVQAEHDKDAKEAIAREALRFRRQATVDQIAALDETLPWLYALVVRSRAIVMARSMSFGPGERKISYNRIGRQYGMTGERVRQIYNEGISSIVRGLTQTTA